jgi:hypothetical protein
MSKKVLKGGSTKNSKFIKPNTNRSATRGKIPRHVKTSRAGLRLIGVSR